jgi:hypothetical protein
VFQQIDTRVPRAVEEQVASIHRKLFPTASRAFVPKAFEWVIDCFEGRYDDYQPIDALYHDLEHTLQGTLCLARLLHGRAAAQAQPAVDAKAFELGLLAILFHDTGYLKKRGDTDGTGAKYTPIHVGRSAEFARDFLARQGYAAPDLIAVQNMIRCTGVNADLSAIPFQNQLERIMGLALGTADLLGQMAAKDYIEKLPVLFEEFAEAARLGGERGMRFGVYRNADDLMRNTPGFWHGYVLPRINEEFQGLYKFLNDPYPDGPNRYLQRIEENLHRLERKLQTV